MNTRSANTAEQLIHTTYTVAGMSCAHCHTAVAGEIGKLPGVSTVVVHPADGTVTVASSAPLRRDAVAAAVDEAGYLLA
ncbi:Cation-transporting ATPase pacS [Arthrobacter crystallopoietes BAB-32]|uniref:Cation-transporting ATPase pacS n=1 Tax=Arthrobacter crystallopoietes BAB-32 TaxID=1246476 RepID=N1UTF1_9MICC|nr:cation transporter [Arthrobacter crystallopoietes]EMY32320.1 Cation-transporting ATPase pacS [Arthrobacter crystallopoietes BAB-32]